MANATIVILGIAFCIVLSGIVGNEIQDERHRSLRQR